MKAVVAERGQVTIPKAIRDKLGIRPGMVMEFSIEEGRLVARKQADDRVSEVTGCLPTGSTNEVIARLRGEK